MSNKSQLNSMSKREILETLMHEQTQSNATLSRLITAVARTAKVDAKELAKIFIDDKGNQDYINEFNVEVKAQHVSVHKDGDKPAEATPTEPTDNMEDASAKPE